MWVCGRAVMPTHSLDYTIGYHETAKIAKKTLRLTQFFQISYTLDGTGEVGMQVAFGRVRRKTSPTQGFCASLEYYMLSASRILWKHFIMDVTTLLEVDSPFFICGINHRWEEHTCPCLNLIAAC